MARGPTGDRGDLERVRDASDIVRIIGEHVALKPKGREYAGLCPFHDDHRPSMNVVPAKQIFHCFVCGAGGDVFSFVQKHHKMEFREALEYLAERAGIELKRPDRARGTGDGGKPEITRADLVRANASAADFFRAILRHTEHGIVGRDLVERRGISPEMVERFGVGLSPDRWDGLLITAQKMGMDPGVFHEAGLLKRRDQAGGGGGYYDSFRHRLIFPIQDQIGRVIAFGGRKIREEDDPKYLNSPETRIFEKAGTLYGLHQAARAIQAERVAVITEGYTDTIACHQAGIENVVATLGTALTPRHAAVLRRLCDTVVLLFDGDLAGQKAADRAVEVFIAEELGVRIATLAGVTDAKDPDELLKREGGADLLRRAIASSTDLLRYRYERVRASLGGASPERMNRVIEDEIDRLVSLGLNDLRPLRRQFIVRQLAAIAGVPERTIERSIPGGRPGARPPAAVPADSRSPRTRAEEMLGCVLCDALLAAGLEGDTGSVLAASRFGAGPAARVARALEDGAADLAAVLAHLSDDDEAKALAVALAEHVFALTDGGKRVREHWDECARLERLDAERAAGRGTAASEAGSAERLRRMRDRADAGDRRMLPVPTRAV
ncbi:MAG: DNA primase [Phycisphaerales bacterium]